MDEKWITRQLEANYNVFASLLSGVEEDMYRWHPEAGKWNLLQVVCHLYDEEREDFRARVKHTLENPANPASPIDPAGWVTERKYDQQVFDQMVQLFLEERNKSVEWLLTLADAPWRNVYYHPSIGEISAIQFLANWLAHDYLHIRQITRIKYQYLYNTARVELGYAGNW